MTYYVIKIDNKEYTLKDVETGAEIATAIGWLTPEQFINYLFSTEKLNAVRDLAEVGLDRLISRA
jgi:hypothetical protein